jgi:hypothetical protein
MEIYFNYKAGLQRGINQGEVEVKQEINDAIGE